MVKFAFFSFRGRIARLAYFGYGLLAVLLCGIVIGVGAAFAVNDAIGPAVILIGLGGVGMFWTSLALSIKRLHDMNLSGHHLWWIYGISVLGAALEDQAPALSILFGVVNLGIALWMLFTRGTNGDNRFGPSPITVRDERADYFVPPNQRV